MRVPLAFARFVWRRLAHLVNKVPDEIIGHNARWRKTRPGGAPVSRPFLLRWYVFPKNKFFNIYLHQFIRDDEDRALHDHPWFNLSFLLGGQYIEHTIRKGGVHWRHIYKAGALKFRTPWSAHRVELTHQWCSADGKSVMNGTPEIAPALPKWVDYSGKSPSWSVFITGPTIHKWGFHCPESGWRTSHKFHERGGCK